MKIYLDDVRDAPEGWIRAKTVTEALRLLRTNTVEEISLDNDLGDGESEGYTLLNIIEWTVAQGTLDPPKMKVHSSNPAARKRMEAAIKQIYKLYAQREETKDVPHL